jgi:hypothetical protein
MRNVIITVIALLMFGCGELFGEDNCDDEIRNSPKPDRTSRIDSGDYHAETRWYGNDAVTYTWQDGSYNSCEITTFTSR